MPTKRIFKFNLKTLLAAFLLLTILIGVTVNAWNRSITQRENVEFLLSYEYRFPDDGDRFPEELRSHATHITVYYRDEVSWNEEEKRFIRDLPYRDNKIYRWIRETLGRDFATSPVAVEISCNDFDLESGEMISTFSQSIVERIKAMPTVQQLWVVPSVQDGKPVNVYSNAELKEHFPDLIFADAALK